MARTTMYEVVNGLTHGRLERRLLELRAEGLSFELMAERVRAEFDINVTTMTVRRWFAALESAEPTPLPRRGRRTA